MVTFFVNLFLGTNIYSYNIYQAKTNLLKNILRLSVHYFSLLSTSNCRT